MDFIRGNKKQKAPKLNHIVRLKWKYRILNPTPMLNNEYSMVSRFLFQLSKAKLKAGFLISYKVIRTPRVHNIDTNQSKSFEKKG